MNCKKVMIFIFLFLIIIQIYADPSEDKAIDLYNKGLIYKSKYIVNWCPRCNTALSDDEVEHKDKDGNLWYIKYPIKDSNDFVIVATTRPETMLGDTAVAFNDKDDKYKNLKDKKIILPLVNREMPTIFDSFVDPEFGTGAVKVTPAHDPNDFDMGVSHNLEFINIFTENAYMNNNVPEKYQGLDRYECRERVVEDLEAQDLIEKITKHKHAVGKCYRCKTVIEPRYSDQSKLQCLGSLSRHHRCEQSSVHYRRGEEGDKRDRQCGRPGIRGFISCL